MVIYWGELVNVPIRWKDAGAVLAPSCRIYRGDVAHIILG